MSKKIFWIVVLMVCVWFFVNRTINYAGVNNNRTTAEMEQWKMNWMSRR